MIGRVAAALIAATFTLSALGTTSPRAAAGRKTIDIYSSLPLHGASVAQTIPLVNGIKLALAQAHDSAGEFNVNYISLDDSTAAAGAWDPYQVARNARRAAADPRGVYYIGEFNSGASEISIPILNQAGMPQVSPDNTYEGLTTGGAGTAPGEPQKFYPTGARTYLRIAPRDAVQAQALLATMHRNACGSVAIANDREAYGVDIASLLRRQARQYRVRIVSSTSINPRARSFRPYADSLRRDHIGCFLFAGIVPNGAVSLVKSVAAALPHARLYGPDGLCTIGFTDSALGGIPATDGRRFQCTNTVLRLSAYPGGRAFAAAYKSMYGVRNPDPYALVGYEAMSLGLDTIAGLGTRGDDRGAIVKALFAIRHRQSVLGTYGFDRHGDTTLRSYGLYRVGPHGSLDFERNAL